MPGRGAVVDRKGGHGPENVLLPLDVDVVRDLRRKRFQERFVPALLAAQGVGLGREVFGLRESRAAPAAAPEPDAGRDVGGVAPAQGVVRLGVGLFRGGCLRVERDALPLPDVVLRIGGFEAPVALLGVAIEAPGLGVADFMPARVVPFEARAERSLQVAALDVTALRLGFDVHHLLLFGRVVSQALCLGAEILVDPHASDIRGFEVGEGVGGFRAEEVFPVDQHPFDLLSLGVDLVVLDLDPRQLFQQLRETVVGHGFERSRVVDRRVAPEDHGDLLPDDHDLRDRLFVDLHLDLDPSPESGIPVALFKRFVAHVGDLQIDRVAENPVAAVDGHDTVEILLDGRAPQRVGLADDRDRSAQQRVVRLLVLDHDDRARRPAEVHEMGGDGEGLERMIPRRVCGGHADKPEKGENQ